MRERERERKYKDMITHPTKKREHDEYSLSKEFIQGERVSEWEVEEEKEYFNSSLSIVY